MTGLLEIIYNAVQRIELLFGETVAGKNIAQVAQHPRPLFVNAETVAVVQFFFKEFVKVLQFFLIGNEGVIGDKLFGGGVNLLFVKFVSDQKDRL